MLSAFGRFYERGGAVRFRPILRAGGCCPLSADSTSGGGGGGGGGAVGVRAKHNVFGQKRGL